MLDPKKTNDLLNKLLMIAKEDRASKPYSKDESFIPKIIFIGPNDETVIGPMTWRNEAEKYEKMALASDAAKAMCAQAIAFVSDTRWLQSDKFNEHFKIEGPATPLTDKTVKEYQTRYYAILSNYGGLIKNLPRHLWNEAVMAAIKGPRCGTHSILAPYTQGPGDRVQYLTRDQSKFAGERNPEEWKEHMNLIPEWWQ
jgi:hypothetical protein